jgi:hypothetical protein
MPSIIFIIHRYIINMHSEGNKIIASGDDTMDDNTIGVSDGLIVVSAPTPIND